MGHKEWSKEGKKFTRCYTIVSKFWDEFNANFVLLHFSSYRSIKIWYLYFKNVEKKGIPLWHQIIFNVKAFVRYFLSNFYFFSSNDSPLKLWKMFFISSQKFFSFWRYSIFCNFFPSFPLSWFKRANGSGIIYDVMNWLA